MTEILAKASALIDAPPAVVYGLLADYREGHPAILPRKYFTGCEVLEGGAGAGTAVRVSMNVMGAKQILNLVISEPEPGRILMETDHDAGVETCFIVDPVEGGARSNLTIATRAQAGSGLRGLMERLVNPPIMRRIYLEELRIIAAKFRHRTEGRSHHEQL